MPMYSKPIAVGDVKAIEQATRAATLPKPVPPPFPTARVPMPGGTTAVVAFPFGWERKSNKAWTVQGPTGAVADATTRKGAESLCTTLNRLAAMAGMRALTASATTNGRGR